MSLYFFSKKNENQKSKIKLFEIAKFSIFRKFDFSKIRFFKKNVLENFGFSKKMFFKNFFSFRVFLLFSKFLFFHIFLRKFIISTLLDNHTKLQQIGTFYTIIFFKQKCEKTKI